MTDPTDTPTDALEITTDDWQKRTYVELNPETKLLEVIDKLTGQVLAIQETPQDLLMSTENFTKIKTPDGYIYLENGLSLDRVANRRRTWIYGKVISELIAQRIIEGESLTAVCRDPGMPSISTVHTWRKEHDNFESLLAWAYKARGEWHRDKAFEEVESAPLDASEFRCMQAKVDFHKWAAGKDAPKTFGSGTKTDQAGVAILNLIVNTGITRESGEGVIEGEVVKDVTPKKTDGK